MQMMTKIVLSSIPFGITFGMTYAVRTNYHAMSAVMVCDTLHISVIKTGPNLKIVVFSFTAGALLCRGFSGV